MNEELLIIIIEQNIAIMDAMSGMCDLNNKRHYTVWNKLANEIKAGIAILKEVKKECI